MQVFVQLVLVRQSPSVYDSNSTIVLKWRFYAHHQHAQLLGKSRKIFKIFDIDKYNVNAMATISP